MYAKKLHTLRLWQKNCTPSGFYGKKIAPFWAASLSEIAIWCATWTGMQNNCSIIKLYYRVLIISIAAVLKTQMQKNVPSNSPALLVSKHFNFYYAQTITSRAKYSWMPNQRTKCLDTPLAKMQWCKKNIWLNHKSRIVLDLFLH